MSSRQHHHVIINDFNMARRVLLAASMTMTIIDVRSIPPRERHPKIFATWRALAAGESFMLVNDHDPKPLYYHFNAEHAGEFDWEYLESGPEVWRVRIGRTGARP
jgi:uncharacterized protein (DUF2249 family)